MLQCWVSRVRAPSDTRGRCSLADLLALYGFSVGVNGVGIVGLPVHGEVFLVDVDLGGFARLLESARRSNPPASGRQAEILSLECKESVRGNAAGRREASSCIRNGCRLLVGTVWPSSASLPEAPASSTRPARTAAALRATRFLLKLPTSPPPVTSRCASDGVRPQANCLVPLIGRRPTVPARVGGHAGVFLAHLLFTCLS